MSGTAAVRIEQAHICAVAAIDLIGDREGDS